MNNSIPLAAIERIFSKAGARRVSKEAKLTFRNYIEHEAGKLAEKILRLTINANRKTVRADDMIVIKQEFSDHKPIEKDYEEY